MYKIFQLDTDTALKFLYNKYTSVISLNALVLRFQVSTRTESFHRTALNFLLFFHGPVEVYVISSGDFLFHSKGLSETCRSLRYQFGRLLIPFKGAVRDLSKSTLSVRETSYSIQRGCTRTYNVN